MSICHNPPHDEDDPAILACGVETAKGLDHSKGVLSAIHMNPREFDKFAEEYTALLQANIAASGETPEYFANYKIQDLKRLVSHDVPRVESGRFLDFGGGVGTSVPFFRKHFPGAHLTCVDVSVKSLEIGVIRFGSPTSFVAFDGSRLPFPDATFDCAFAACVFHHIPHEAHGRLLGEMRRVLKPSGQVMIYEHNPFNPLTVRAVNKCPFDENAILIRAGTLKARLESAGFRQLQVRYRVFFPRQLRWLRRIEDKLAWLPIGAQYYVCGRR
jgi:ubiquinone/menaquinone biosynthesis C-methylase UbiE